MSNDDHTLGAVLGLAAGGAAGYAAGRWLVEPWRGHRNAAAAVMQPRDPYGDTAPRTDGPITSPAQVDAALAAPRQPHVATSAGVRRFDPVFERYRGGLPLAYVHALVDRESEGRPDARNGSALGLLQIRPVVLADYNRRHGTAVQSAQLTDPATNVAIGCELLARIIESYRAHHPAIPNLRADWTNPRFVKLLTFGWNAGFSEAGGVGRVARYLEQLGATDLTIDVASAYAPLAGASHHLSNPAKVAWCKSVVALYRRERALGAVLPAA